MGPQGVKAKYVRVELRKIETLPGGAQNSFYDFVGQSPINLWQSSEEYSMLQSVSSSFAPFFLVPHVEYSKIFLSTFEYPSQFPRLLHSKVAVRVPSRAPWALRLIFGSVKLASSMSSWARCAFKARRTCSLLCQKRAFIPFRRSL